MPSPAETLALVGAVVQPSPREAAIGDGVVLVRGGVVAAVGSRSRVAVPVGATVVDCAGLFLVAGFQNSHVHFTEARWQDAAARPAVRLSEQLARMLLRHGFTTVVDTGSDLANTMALRARIDSGEVIGPRILTAGTPLYPENGIPFYLKDSLTAEVLGSLNTPATAEEAAAVAERQLSAGSDVIKLFTGSWVERGRVLPMGPEVAAAAAERAHRRGRLVFAHASSVAGLESALAARVDVLAHALDDDRGLDASHYARMKAAGMAMIPTLKLFGGQPYTRYIQEEVAAYARAGGVILFGTDVGYLADDDPAEEYALMAGAGLGGREILAALTTAPAERFGEGGRRGRVASGMDADLVLLGADPSTDPTAFADVRFTVRAGRIVHRRP